MGEESRMAERMTVVVKPVEEKTNLTVEDAMRQVLDVFELLNVTPSESGQEVVWRLIEAKTSSPPFTVIAEAAAKPGVDVDPQIIDRAAREKKARLTREFQSFKNGQLPEAWEEFRAQRVASDLLDRLRHGVIVEMRGGPDEPSTILTSEDSKMAEKVLELPVAHVGRMKDQMGTIEGTLVEVSTWWSKPALIISERKSGVKITCVINAEQSAEIARAGTFEDVWQHRRIAVRGLIRYGKSGNITRIDATSVIRKEHVDVPDERIKDKDFTDGLNAVDYLSRLREGDLG
jgi:hypothetical protein